MTGPAPDPLEVVHRDLLRTAHRRMAAIDPQLAAGHEGRLASHRERGLAALLRGLAGAGVTSADLDDAASLARRDPRFSFLLSIPSAAGVSTALGHALCTALHGDVSAKTLETGALHGAFNMLLDGLVDETPELLAPHQAALMSLASPDVLLARTPPPSLAGDAHPVVAITHKVGLECVRRARERALANPDAHEAFVRAAQDAMRAEAASAHIQVMHKGPVDEVRISRGLAAKSEATLLAQALALVSDRGLPQCIDRWRFEACMRKMGGYGGWLDDLRDIPEDLASERWSRALLAFRPRGDAPATPVLRLALQAGLAHDGLQASLIEHLEGEQMALRADLASLKLDHPLVLALLVDIALMSTDA